MLEERWGDAGVEVVEVHARSKRKPAANRTMQASALDAPCGLILRAYATRPRKTVAAGARLAVDHGAEYRRAAWSSRSESRPATGNPCGSRAGTTRSRWRRRPTRPRTSAARSTRTKQILSRVNHPTLPGRMAAAVRATLPRNGLGSPSRCAQRSVPAASRMWMVRTTGRRCPDTCGGVTTARCFRRVGARTAAGRDTRVGGSMSASRENDPRIRRSDSTGCRDQRGVDD